MLCVDVGGGCVGSTGSCAGVSMQCEGLMTRVYSWNGISLHDHSALQPETSSLGIWGCRAFLSFADILSPLPSQSVLCHEVALLSPSLPLPLHEAALIHHDKIKWLYTGKQQP